MVYILVLLGCAFFLFGSSVPEQYDELISILISPFYFFSFLFFIFLIVYCLYILFSLNNISKEMEYLSKNRLFYLDSNECKFLTLNLRYNKKRIFSKNFYFPTKEWDYFKVPLKYIKKVEIIKNIIIYPLFDNSFANFLSRKLKLGYIFSNVIIFWFDSDYIYGYRISLNYDPNKELIIKEIDEVKPFLSGSGRFRRYDEKNTGDDFFYGLIYKYKGSYFTILPLVSNLNSLVSNLNGDDFKKNADYIVYILGIYSINMEIKDKKEFNKE